MPEFKLPENFESYPEARKKSLSDHERIKRAGPAYCRCILYIYSMGTDPCGRCGSGCVMWNWG